MLFHLWTQLSFVAAQKFNLKSLKTNTSMEISAVRWLSELGMEDPSLMYQCDINSLNYQFTPEQIQSALTEDFHHSFSSESYSSYPTFNPTQAERPTKQLKTTHWSSSYSTDQASTHDSSSHNLLSFYSQASPNKPQQYSGNLGNGSFKPKEETVSTPRTPKVPSEIMISPGLFMNQNDPSKTIGIKRTNTGSSKPPSNTQDHIIAERKRREKLSQRFIALSAIVPGLKKMDKASVLGDAIKYVKQMQERVKTLEEQSVQRTVKSVVIVKKSQVCIDDNSSSSDENFEDRSVENLPEIEARVSDKNILLRIHCEKRKGILGRTLSEIEKLNLTVVNTSVMSFTSSAFDMSVIAQMDEEFCMSVKDLLKNLRSALMEFM